MKKNNNNRKINIMELNEDTLNNLEDNADIIKKNVNNVWYNVIINLIKEVRRLRNKYE